MRFLSLVALAAVLAVPASAQTSFLVKGGLNTAFFSGSDARGTDPRLGAVAGAGVRLGLTPALSAQVEALYSQEGAVEADGSGTFKLDYLDIPVLVRYGVPVGRFAEAGLYAGPQIGIPLRAEFDAEFGAVESEQTRTEVAIAVGADYGSGPISIDLRYVIGIQDAFDDEIDGVPVELLDIKNQAFTATLAYRFGGGY